MFTEIILSVKVFLKNPDFEVITEFDAVAEERGTYVFHPVIYSTASTSPPQIVSPPPCLVDQTRVATRKVALVNIFEKIGLRPTNDIPLLSSNALDVKIEVGDEEEEEEIEEDGQRNQDVLGGVSSSSKPSTMSAAASVKTGFLSSSTTTTELQAVDLQAIYNKAQFLGERYHVKLEPRQGMKYTLREYQKQALAFMVRKENMNVGSSEEQSCSPLWREYALPENTNLFFYFNPFSGELSMKKPIEEHCRGG